VKAVVQHQTKKNSGASQEYNAAIDFGDGLSELMLKQGAPWFFAI
jgi:hypothetical protein